MRTREGTKSNGKHPTSNYATQEANLPPFFFAKHEWHVRTGSSYPNSGTGIRNGEHASHCQGQAHGGVGLKLGLALI